LPVLAALAGAVRGLRGFERVFVDRFDGEVANDVSDPTGVDIVALDLGRSLLEVPATKRALIVGELDEDQLGALTTLRGIAIDREHDVRDVHNRGLTSTEQRVDLLQLSLQLKLALLESLDFLLELREIVASLCQGSPIGGEYEDGQERDEQQLLDHLSRTVPSVPAIFHRNR
jgi:hypothetical protein